MNPGMRAQILKISLWVVVVIIGAMPVSCGKKGPPTLTTFAKPAAVANITAARRENSILLSWPYSETGDLVKGFYLEKAEGPAGAFRKIAFLPDTARSYVDTDFETGRAYFYRITVLSLRENLSDLSPVLKVVPAALPAPPSGLAYEVTNDSVKIKWNEAPAGSEVKYNIYKSHEKRVFPEAPLNGTALNGPSFSDSVETGRPTYYVVRSFLDKPLKAEGFPSEALEVDPGTFVPSKPSGLKYAYAPKGLVLIWNENPETWVKSYRVYRKKSAESAFSAIGESVTPTLTDPGPLTSNTEYYITALGPLRESAPSEPVGVNPQPAEENR